MFPRNIIGVRVNSCFFRVEFFWNYVKSILVKRKRQKLPFCLSKLERFELSKWPRLISRKISDLQKNLWIFTLWQFYSRDIHSGPFNQIFGSDDAIFGLRTWWRTHCQRPLTSTPFGKPWNQWAITIAIHWIIAISVGALKRRKKCSFCMNGKKLASLEKVLGLEKVPAGLLLQHPHFLLW